MLGTWVVYQAMAQREGDQAGAGGPMADTFDQFPDAPRHLVRTDGECFCDGPVRAADDEEFQDLSF
ncbi:hypothetical protein DWB77_07536 [Streptomyces hundungensis]|uniref:Uncharacterized protein n=1 Tax=Streptomyces hundungensis TaxID=1077946 RepID=A0A387HP00_9ACTN|nr:hypothetical protein [Streptomyces hundungensis]AYG85319.1 hypothetical protein DWB77_07536 [Streptomyces hundungensis]